METKYQNDSNQSLKNHKVVSTEEWIEARKQLLKKEKELTRLNDRINEERRSLPWEKIDKDYVFDTPTGKETLFDLFEGRSQLIIKHFMFAPEWKEGCVGCSFGADHIDGANLHLKHHDVTVVAVSRASLAQIELFKKRMGWKFKWVSSQENDFNYDFHVSCTKEDLEKGQVYYNYNMLPAESEEMPGISVFYKDDNGNIYHTYSTFARGDEKLVGAYMFLDLTPKGRNETGANGNLMDWVKHHDKYDADSHIKNNSCCEH